MKLQNITSGFAFTRNPIILGDNSQVEASDHLGGRIAVNVDGSDIVGRFYPPLSVDLSDILEAYTRPFPEPPDVGLDFSRPGLFPLHEIEDMAEFSCRKVNVSWSFDSYEGECSFTAIPGGISKQNLRRLINAGKDIFDARFLNYKGNFFLTTRTAGWRVFIKETELYPLYFICPDGMGDLEIKDAGSGKVYSCGGIDPGVMALDIELLRRAFIEEFDVLPSILDVYVDSVFACRLVVEMAECAKERYRLKFRNSLGVFEILEITGELSLSPAYDDEARFMRYDADIGDYISERERVPKSQIITVKSGVKRSDEIGFMMDMLASDEVYLLDFSKVPVKVIPSAEKLEYKKRQTAPENFTLRLEMAESEINICEDLADGCESEKPRVFSAQFIDKFN